MYFSLKIWKYSDKLKAFTEPNLKCLGLTANMKQKWLEYFFIEKNNRMLNLKWSPVFELLNLNDLTLYIPFPSVNYSVI